MFGFSLLLEEDEGSGVLLSTEGVLLCVFCLEEPFLTKIYKKGLPHCVRETAPFVSLQHFRYTLC